MGNAVLQCTSEEPELNPNPFHPVCLHKEKGGRDLHRGFGVDQEE